jgi:hypothetical protein
MPCAILLGRNTRQQLAIVGSPALGKVDNGWEPALKAKVEESYNNLLMVTLYEYDISSIEFTQGDAIEEVLSESPDLFLYEPFSLINNTVGVPEDQNEETILTFQNKLKKANKHATLLLQPPYPIVGATYYPRDIKELKAFSKEQDLSYLDHWEAWQEGDELEDYLVEDIRMDLMRRGMRFGVIGWRGTSCPVLVRLFYNALELKPYRISSFNNMK